MSDLVQINNNKENVLEFELSIEGVSTKDIDAKFVIRSAEMDLAFICENKEGNKWTVKLPPLAMLERTAYPFHFQVIADGYHFKPMEGQINVVGSNDVYVTTPKNKLTAPTKPVEKIEETKEVKTQPVKPPVAQPTKQREKPIEQIARELMEGNKLQVKKDEVTPILAKTEEEPKEELKTPTVTVTEALLPTITKDEPKKLTAKDEAVLAILEEVGARPKNTKPRPRFSFLKGTINKD